MTTTRTRPALTFLLLACGTATFSMLQSLLSPVLPTIQDDLDTTRSAVSWILIAWLLSSAVATPILGKVGDMIGKARTLSISLAAIIVGSLIAALAPNIEMVILGRIVQGLGGAVFPLSFGIIRDEFPSDKVPSAVGVMSAIIAVGGGLGVLLAGPIVGLFDWRWLFWLPMAVVAVVGLFSWRYVPESPVRAPGRINWLAATLLAGWLLALLLPLSQGTQWGWTSPAVIGLLIAAVVLIVAWIAVEMRTDNPVIDMRVMRLPAVWTTNLVAFLFGAAMFAIYAFLPQFMQLPAETGYGFGASVSLAGLMMLPMLVTMAVTGVVSGPLAAFMGFKTQLAGGSALLALACLGFAFLHGAVWEVLVEGAIFGVGMGLAYAAMVSLIVQNVPSGQTGVATGMNANIRTIGGAIGTAVMTAIVTADHAANGLPSEHGFTIGFALFGIIAILAVFVALLVPGRRPALAPNGLGQTA